MLNFLKKNLFIVIIFFITPEGKMNLRLAVIFGLMIPPGP